jgi:hypothetical protein
MKCPHRELPSKDRYHGGCSLVAIGGLVTLAGRVDGVRNVCCELDITSVAGGDVLDDRNPNPVRPVDRLRA